jgi:hypothetical protein
MDRIKILQTGIELTSGDRNRTYGDPADNMRDISDILFAMSGIRLTPAQVVQVHMATKLARLKKTPFHADSAIDLAVYTAIYHEVLMGGNIADP